MSKTINLTVAEKHALIEAAEAFGECGIEIPLPWEGDLDDRETELYVALVESCRAYSEWMRKSEQ